MDSKEVEGYIAKAYQRALDEMAEDILREAYRPLHQRPLYASIFADDQVDAIHAAMRGFQSQTIDTTAIVLPLSVPNSTPGCCTEMDRTDEPL